MEVVGYVGSFSAIYFSFYSENLLTTSSRYGQSSFNDESSSDNRSFIAISIMQPGVRVN